MQRRYKEHRHRRHSTQDRSRRNPLTSALRKPGTQIAFLVVVGLIIFLILQMGGGNKRAISDLPRTISVSDAYNLYKNGSFVLDVRTQEEWNEYHVPGTTLIPLEQLPSRLNEVPRDRQIVVVCRTGNRSQQGRDILLNAGFKQVTSMTGGLTEWRASGYPTEP
jgi:rhodanese-related sulfurtransferase